MNPDLLRNYLARHRAGRRDVLRLAGAVGAASAAGLVGAAPAGAEPAAEPAGGRWDDVPFDYADPANLADWAPSRYGRDDQRGALNEVTPAKTAAALGLLRARRDVTTYNLGELLWNGFPAFRTDPRRTYEQRLTIWGYPPPPGFQEEGGILVSLDPLGRNRVSVHEERFEAEFSAKGPKPLATTFQIGTQTDNLNHVGAAEFFYNGLRGPDIARGHGTTRLGAEHVGPVVTRGVLLDVLGVKLARGRVADLAEPAANGRPLLRENYRITVEDIRDALEFGGVDRIEPGDAVLFHTGWSHLLARRDPADLARWEGSRGLPGIYLREARWLARHRPALVGGDTWALEVLGNPVNDDGTAFPVHQELLMRHGIRIGESYVVHELAADRVHEFVFIVTPQYSEGATAGNTPPAALGQPRRR
ncbi:cyclase family protein [Actinosynnema sp. NPDC047251]|uniref:Putative cyclase n=1 Tax=Saccharothrix espanaensis (strain ATCC 51144 / DSM 44229 / JCM 9112 / NBRC 15066 / NRRL 15764) TaxID=1179773 RepID=K0K1R4_SACES|nr:cyclase family protein [Saccharothrix espanaensis]CCH30804.1 putative cyclase [Saccharothrix espanaensis DSM 44229]